MYKSPDIFAFAALPTFFTEFLRLNQAEFTHRSFASNIDWPISLMSDVVAKRRNLSLERAIEFSRFVGMTGVEAERFVILALAEINHVGVKEFTQNYLKTEGRTVSEPTPEQPSKSGASYVSPDDIADMALSSLKCYLMWCKGQTTAEEVGEFLYLSPELRDLRVLEAKMDALRERGAIEGDFPNVKVLTPATGSSGMNRFQYFQTVDALRPLMEMKERRNIYWNMSRATFPRRHYAELIQRLEGFLNWFANHAMDYDQDSLAERNDFVLLQVNLMVSNLLDLTRLGMQVKVDPSTSKRHINLEHPQALA